ncbi:Glutamate receptor [Quillaja saponaria]|uniref:Glutamate receptor n=1 Tax=Quillaja saponaria TaxID=32244 RepID=A0AAD7LHW1_QUISA|nr:Glutamate receptor [Quillaja saponaria]
MAENRSGTTIPVVNVEVGVVVDTAGSVGKMGLSSINLSISDFYASHAYYKTRLLFHVKDSNKDVVAAAAAGETSSVPKGWEIPTNGKKLRIGVPVKHGFYEFVNINHDLSSNTTECNGESAGTYDDLIYQVFSGGFDAVVGDTTIIANRSQYVDFTLPYTEAGVSMIVPVKDNRRKKAWVFLKPLTLDLWVTSACSFGFIRFVVWVLEHRINEVFRGPPSHQIGASFWFSFSTLVFAHRERGLSNLARFVVIVWVFVVLILTQSYTASLTTMSTVEQLHPTIKSYSSADQLDELLTNGSNKGGIAATLDQIPYTRLFLGNYCSKNTTAGPTFRTDGFGFVFPIGSPVAADMSRAILKVTEGDNMTKIEKAWFRSKGSCSDPLSRPDNSANSLGLDSFWSLFLIAGVASVSALFTFAIRFLYEHRHVLLPYNPDTSIWRRIGILFRIFDHKDLSSHTFRKSAMQDKSDIARAHGLSAVETSSSTHYPPSPTNRTNPTFPFMEIKECLLQSLVTLTHMVKHFNTLKNPLSLLYHLQQLSLPPPINMGSYIYQFKRNFEFYLLC